MMWRSILWKLLAGGAAGLGIGATAGMLREWLAPQTDEPLIPHQLYMGSRRRRDRSKQASEKQAFLPRILPGGKAEYLPAIGAMLLAGLGTYLSYKTISDLLEKRRKKKIELGLDRARLEYLRALSELSEASGEMPKSSSFGFPQMLDGIADIYFDEGIRKEAINLPSVTTSAAVIATLLFFTSLYMHRKAMTDRLEERRKLKAYEMLRRYRALYGPTSIKAPEPLPGPKSPGVEAKAPGFETAVSFGPEPEEAEEIKTSSLSGPEAVFVGSFDRAMAEKGTDFRLQGPLGKASQDFTTRQLLMLPLIAAGVGAAGGGLGAPESRTGRGIWRGSMLGFGTGMGSALGERLGTLPGHLLGSRTLHSIGTLLGLGLGGAAGYGLTRSFMGPAEWSVEREGLKEELRDDLEEELRKRLEELEI